MTNSNTDYIAFAKAYIGKDTKKYILNSEGVSYELFQVNQFQIPLARVEKYHLNNNYTTSLIKSFCDNPCNSILKNKRKVTRYFISSLFQALRFFLKISKLDKNIFINSISSDVCLSMNLSEECLSQLHSSLVDKFPEHSLVLRNLFISRDQALIEQLEKKGYVMFLVTPSYLANYENQPHKVRYRLKKDKQTMEQNGLYYIDYTDLGTLPNSLFERLASFYTQIYITKYSENNPQFTAQWFESALNSNFFKAKFVFKNKIIKGFYFYFFDNEYLIAHVIGHDQTPGVYQACWLALIEEAKKSNKKLFMGSSVEQYKTSRGGVIEREMYAVYGGHLSFYKRSLIILLSKLECKAITLAKKMGIFPR